MFYIVLLFDNISCYWAIRNKVVCGMEYVLYGMELVLVMLILELYVNMDDNNYNDMYAGLEFDISRLCLVFHNNVYSYEQLISNIC